MFIRWIKTIFIIIIYLHFEKKYWLGICTVVIIAIHTHCQIIALLLSDVNIKGQGLKALNKFAADLKWYANTFPHNLSFTFQ